MADIIAKAFVLSNHNSAWQHRAVLNPALLLLIHSPPMVTEDQLGVLSFMVSPLTLHHGVSRLCEQNRMRRVMVLTATLLDSTTTDLECNPGLLPFQLLQSIFDVGQSDQCFLCS